jgi:hypothetical protein
MPALKYAAITLSGLGLMAALAAAFFWWRSSRIYIDVSRMPPEDRTAAYVIGLKFQLSESSWLNSQAAIWTGIAAVLSSVASALGTL